MNEEEKKLCVAPYKMCGCCYYEGGGKEGLIDVTDEDWDIGRGCAS